jgi:hypothetical protein
VIDALAALLRGKRVDEQMGRTDQALFHGCSRLKSEQLIPQRGIEALAELRQRLEQDNMSL